MKTRLFKNLINTFRLENCFKNLLIFSVVIESLLKLNYVKIGN